MKTKIGCLVYCKNTGKTFKSITAAARYLKIDSWTMSRKMQKFGYFEDANGNKYEREYPMVSKNVYSAGTQPKLQKTWTRSKKVIKNKIITAVSKTDCPDLVRKACAEKIKAEIKATPIWKDICEVMDFLGVKQLIITKD